MTKELTVPEKQVALRSRRSAAVKIERKFLVEGGVPEQGKGKGKEPRPWCECHNRNPCPIDKELNN